MQESLRYDHYRLLGVERNASTKEIKHAYRERVKHCHPDRNPSPQAASVFQAVHRAYQELKDPDRRQNYDQRLQFYRSVTSKPAAPRSTGSRTRSHRQRDMPVNRFAFLGLHITGLCFGVALVTGILVGVTFLAWPAYTVVFCLPGLAIIPDSLAGIRIK